MPTFTKPTTRPARRRPHTQRQRCASKPFDAWILEKVWLNDGIFDRSDCFAFDSFWAANRAMFDDWTEEYDGREDREDREDRDDEDTDGFWESQSRPFEDDDESEIIFRDRTAIKWRIYNRSIEGLSPMWDDKDEQ